MYGPKEPENSIAPQKPVAQPACQEFCRKSKADHSGKYKIVADLDVQDLHNCPVGKAEFFKVGVPSEKFPKSKVEQCEANVI